MSSDALLDFPTVQAVLTAENVTVHGSELHGAMTGLICAGYEFENTDYLTLINDFFNNGEGLPVAVKTTIKQLYSEIWQTLLDDSYGFKLLLADDDDSLAERANSIGAWVQGFNLGFGIQQKDTAIASEDVKEVISDFAEIANLSDEIDEDETTEHAFYEIAEYVKVSALLCFSELGAPPATQQEETLH